MSALGLHRLVPRSLLAGRLLVVLECYLDDSGKDPQSHITTVAGYIAHESEWRAFEDEVEPIFERRKVSILHAKQLEDTDGDFKNWKVVQKQAFVAQICQLMSRHLSLGVTMSAAKVPYRVFKGQTPTKYAMSPYTFCFNVIIDWILKDIFLGGAAHADGIALFLEAGHENNAEAEKLFHELRSLFRLENVLRSITFIPKDSCRAIQVADLLAFYSRRDAVAFDKATQAKKDHKESAMIKLITRSLRHHGFVATGFFPDRLDRKMFRKKLRGLRD